GEFQFEDYEYHGFDHFKLDLIDNKKSNELDLFDNLPKRFKRTKPLILSNPMPLKRYPLDKSVKIDIHKDFITFNEKEILDKVTIEIIIKRSSGFDDDVEILEEESTDEISFISIGLLKIDVKLQMTLFEFVKELNKELNKSDEYLSFKVYNYGDAHFRKFVKIEDSLYKMY